MSISSHLLVATELYSDMKIELKNGFTEKNEIREKVNYSSFKN